MTRRIPVPRVPVADVSPLARQIARLLEAAPAPSATATEWAAWLLRKANVYDGIACAAGDPTLAADAAGMARSARAQATACRRGGPRPYLSASALIAGNASDSTDPSTTTDMSSKEGS